MYTKTSFWIIKSIMLLLCAILAYGTISKNYGAKEERAKHEALKFHENTIPYCWTGSDYFIIREWNPRTFIARTKPRQR